MTASAGGGISGSSDGQSITVNVTNGATRIYVDWPDGTFEDYPVPVGGKLRIEYPSGVTGGVVSVTDMNVPDPASTSFAL